MCALTRNPSVIFVTMKKKGIFASLMIALTAALGYAFAALPNIEFMTLTVFIAGYLLGWRLGMIVGAAAMSLHAAFNPLGFSLPPLMAVQVASFALIGLAGSVVAPLLKRVPFRPLVFVSAGMTGFVLTLMYDLSTSMGAYVVGVGITDGLWKFVIGGVLFMITHQVWNAALFFVALPPMLNVLHPFREGFEVT